MKQRTVRLAIAAAVMGFMLGMGLQAAAQTCTAGDDIDVSTRTAIQNAANQFFQMVQQGNTAALQQNSIQEVASNFSAVATAVNEIKEPFATAQATIKATYELDNSPAPGSGQAFSGPTTQHSGRLEFFCGIYNSPDRVAFVFDSLPPGKYAVVIMGVTTSKAPYLLSMILQQENGQWKLAGFYPKAEQLAGHDPAWYVTQARQYKNSGQKLNSWLYYQVAYNMWQPFPAMNAPTLDKLYDEMQQVQPSDLGSGQPMQLNAGAQTYQVTSMFPTAVADALDVVVRYQLPDISNTAKTFQDNTNVMKALVAQYPQLREAFNGIVARAVAPNGQDYGTLLAMKDIK